jgi:hypothetical protein
MNKQIFNPFLPSYEYIPDGEPYVFGDRVYVYGSHDKFNGIIFCMNDYVCWSAPVDDLSDWRYEGTIYKKNQDPKNPFGIRLLFAPDVVKGIDGRYYLYYGIGFMGIMGVAVCDTPAGKYEFYGHIHYADGHVWGRKHGEPFPFDPGVLVDDDGRVYLYSGFATRIPAFVTGGKRLTFDGGVVTQLESDMITIKNGPTLLFPKEGEKAFYNHSFFEASSIRKIGHKYYFVYSSSHNHELCYAVSDSPMGGFQYGGTLVSLGDLYLDGNEGEVKGVNYLGNTHGGLLNLNNQWYIFYHRQTNRHSYSRQACAEPLVMTKDGEFLQAEITSSGLNNAALIGKGRYEARIACNLWSKEGVGRYDCLFPRLRFSKHPYFTQDGKDREKNPNQYIANMRDKAVAGFKYFNLKDIQEISVRLRGKAKGKLLISSSKDFSKVEAVIPIKLNKRQSWTDIRSVFKRVDGIHALYFKYEGIGKLDFLSFEIISDLNEIK